MNQDLVKYLIIGAVTLLGLLLADTILAAAEPIEIRVRATAQTNASIVRLGDLAEIYANSTGVADKWRALPLFPAPAPGRTQAISSREVQDVVALHHGTHAQLRWTGAAEIRLTATDGNSVPAHTGVSNPEPIALVSQPAAKPSSPLTVEASALTSQLIAACQAFLESQSQSNGWQVRPRIASKELAILAQAGNGWRVASVDSLSIGMRRFGVSLSNGASLSIPAEVSQSTIAVVAKRALPRGTMLSADQLSLEPASTRYADQQFATRLEEVVGQELQQPVQAGQPIDIRQVRKPLMVRRGGPVLVIAWASGVKVKTNGRVLADGAQGDLVEVQAVDGNDRYMARVIEPRTVEVFAGVLSVPADGVREEPKLSSRRAVQPIGQ